MKALWKVEFRPSALKELKKISSSDRKKILLYLNDRVVKGDDPRVFGKALKGNLKGLWRYRIGDYRLVCEIKDEELIVFALRVAHRKDVYD